MSIDVIKSPKQLKYELDKTKTELTSLLTNWRKKSEELLGRLVTFRAELKEIEAVMAATEKSYTAYCALAKPILNVIKPSSIPLQVKLSKLESLPPEPVLPNSEILNHILVLTHAAEKAETIRITRLRDEYRIQSDYIHRKSKEIYTLLNEERKNVDSYAVLLQSKITGLEEQYKYQTNQEGLESIEL